MLRGKEMQSHHSHFATYRSKLRDRRLLPRATVTAVNYMSLSVMIHCESARLSDHSCLMRQRRRVPSPLSFPCWVWKWSWLFSVLIFLWLSDVGFCQPRLISYTYMVFYLFFLSNFICLLHSVPSRLYLWIPTGGQVHCAQHICV